MTARVVWTEAAFRDLEHILAFTAARSTQGAATIAARIAKSVHAISTLPKAARYDKATGVYERAVPGLPLLIIYEVVAGANGGDRAEIIAVFHTSRDPDGKPTRERKK